MTTSSHFSIWRHLSRRQIALTMATGLLAGAIAILILSVYVNILATNSAFEEGYIVADLTDIQRAILLLDAEYNKTLSTRPVNFEALDLQRALISSQLRLALSEAAGKEVTTGLDRIQEILEEYDRHMAPLQANPSPEQIAVIAPELDKILAELENHSRTLSIQEENHFFNTISTALGTQRTSQTLLLVLSSLLVLFSTVLIFSLRRSIKSEFDQAYYLLEEEVAERKQAEAELRAANERQRELNDHLQQELILARKIQQSLLPPPQPKWNGFDVVCNTRPALEVGGDFYAYHVLGEGHFSLAVGDVSGKGLAAALLMATTLAHFDSTFAFTVSPDDMLAQLDKTLVRYTQTTRQNCALCFLEICRTTLKVANAGGIPPYIRRMNGRVESLDVNGMPLGIGLGAEVGYQALTVTLSPGDLVILTSDGVVEANVTSDQLFSFERLEQAIATGPASSADAMLEHLQTQVSDFIDGADPHDDMTIVVLRVTV